MLVMDPMRPGPVAICDDLNPGAGQDNYDPQKDPVVVYNLGGQVTIAVSDPEMVQDLLGAKNNIFDKTGTIMGVTSKLMGESFLFSPADEAWRAKRKACAHAFYKERLVHMIEVLKDKLDESIKEWAQQIQKSQDGTTVIDIAKVYREIFTRNIIHIAFGEDVSFEDVEIWHSDDHDAGVPFSLKTMSFFKALEAVGTQMLTISMRLKVSNPLWKVIYSQTGASLAFSKVERTIDDNCYRLRAFVRDYIRKRQAGEKRSTVQNSADLLSLFFETPDIFTEEFIIDEIMDFFLAAAATTTRGAVTVTGHFATAAWSVAKVRSEFDTVCKESEDYSPEDKENLSKLQYLKKYVTLQNTQDMTFCGQVITEGLRYMPPVPIGSL